MKTQSFKNAKRICFAGNRMGEKDIFTNEFLKLGFSKLNCFLHYLVKWALAFFLTNSKQLFSLEKCLKLFKDFFSAMTYSMMTLTIKDLIVTQSINATQQ
jgi:hypothetical protein